MTTRLPLVRLDALPPALESTDRLYLKPLPDPALAAAPGALPLAGTPLRFDRLEILLRRSGGIGAAVAPVDRAREWFRGLAEPQALDAEKQLQRLTSARSPVAGIAMTGGAVMGIVNVTPDSFSDGGASLTPAGALVRGRDAVSEGADILDIGGESTRPGASPVDVDEELRRVLPAIERLAGLGAPLSIDSRKAPVMRAALDAGAGLVNDVSALQHDPESLDLVAGRAVPIVLMHAGGDPRTMQEDPIYDHVGLDVFDFLEARIEACTRAGIARDRIVVDPGIGFGKTLAHNIALLRDLALFHATGRPLLLGASRKSFIGRLTGEAVASRRVAGSIAAALLGIAAGAHVLRVHDVAGTVQAVALWRSVMDTEAG